MTTATKTINTSSTMIVTGIVEQVKLTEPYTDQHGNEKRHHDYKISPGLQHDNSNIDWFREAFQPVSLESKASVGDTISFTCAISYKGEYTNYNVKKGTLQVTKQNAAPAEDTPVVQPSATVTGTPINTRIAKTDRLGESIVFQSSLKVALTMLIHNSQGEAVSEDTLLRSTRVLAKAAYNPRLTEPAQPLIKKDDANH